jgi:hypothetical protein
MYLFIIFNVSDINEAVNHIISRIKYLEELYSNESANYENDFSN